MYPPSKLAFKFSPRYRAALLCLALVLFGGVAHGESGSESALKTAFLYNFFKFINWPESVLSQRQTYQLCTTTNDGLGSSLTVLENKRIGDKPLQIRRNVNGSALKDCHLVFIGASENAGNISQALKGLPIATISDHSNFIEQGGMIGLVEDDNRLGFELNLDATNSSGLHLNAQLMKLAKKVLVTP